MDWMIQARVQRYLEFENENEKNGKNVEQRVLSALPVDFQNEILVDYFGKVLSQEEVFSQNFSPGFLRELSLRIEERLLLPG